ncbi:beta-lactamase family protein [Brevibacillus humidisoli]|uniref:serine hydrolase domain-containing protein n=1 Tax=Brevibacillus humidisoli TaxID=2895522 RepID=UPI001E4AA704|nr:serine hydrolase domain-containing protein [Brevibacillus humidisoli]UFJ38885.1 beta-lactamase family protein [Brevibacillus humidisoli]
MNLKHINMNERMKYYRVPGVSLALINDGKLHLAEGYGVLEGKTNRSVTTHSVFHACSISKLATAMLVLRFIEQGILDLDENVNKQLISWKVPDNHHTNQKQVTLRTLLSHQAGFIDPEGSFREHDSEQNIPTMLSLLEGRTSSCPEPISLKYQPGSDFQYSDAGFCVIQQLVEDVTRKSFQQVIKEFIFEPLQMNNSTSEWAIPDTGHDRFACGHNQNGSVIEGKYPIYPYQAAAGLWSTPTDLAMLVIEIMDSLKGKGKLGLSPKLINEMITPQGCSPWTGLGLFLDSSAQELEISSLGWGVGFQSIVIAYPYAGTGAVMMTNADLGVHQTKGIIGEIAASLHHSFCKK